MDGNTPSIPKIPDPQVPNAAPVIPEAPKPKPLMGFLSDYLQRRRGGQSANGAPSKLPSIRRFK